VNRTHASLYYLASYLTIGGIALLLAPQQALKLLLSNGSYGEVFPRVAGMLLTGLGLTVLPGRAGRRFDRDGADAGVVSARSNSRD
jgi:hypothetical protein